ncbi:N-acetylglucosamine-6-phosphate deacetylase [Hydrogenoanaerobacterium sp.]|uniref:N-acetylglucosamine-6-phosphate deacetylase n=1 Tax=Hydrogenoanaerobacterium sp. TaxID=2953763 RepID=UPI00289C23A9|nr:N-acetylglucosamine-6-phosphate deacetylase [Hydrogenoanaerobacterium sp.]
MSYIIKSDQIYYDRKLRPAAIQVKGTAIENVLLSGIPADGEVIDLTGYRVLPGLIDTHMHGGNGFDTMDCKEESIEGMSDYLATVGVTTFFPTTVTSSLERTKKAVETVANCKDRGVGGAKIAGIFLEGPYINKQMKGAHPEEFIVDISLEHIKEVMEAARGNVRTVAIAPEKPGAVETIEYLKEHGVTVAIGHSNATYDETQAAIKAGARACIHIYNAMRPLHHREPGILGASLTTDGFATELICDGIHVHPRSMEIVTRCKHPEDVILITDCMCAGGMPDGKYYLGELPTVVENGVARTEEGALAGSTLKLIQGVKNTVDLIGVPFETAIRYATENPARQLDVFEKTGSLDTGKAADIIAIDDDYHVVFTMIDGKIVMDKR